MLIKNNKGSDIRFCKVCFLIHIIPNITERFSDITLHDEETFHRYSGQKYYNVIVIIVFFQVF